MALLRLDLPTWRLPALRISAVTCGSMDGMDGGARPDGTATIGIGDLVPDLELRDHEGRPWTVGQHRGHPIVLVLHRHLA